MKKAKVSKYGQWKYPGEDTIIPNANGSITMKGVPYPVLGIDDQGNRKMMMPGGEYQFPGNSVYEIPMAKMGGSKRVRIHSLPKAQGGGTWDEYLKTVGAKDPRFLKLTQEEVDAMFDSSGSINSDIVNRYKQTNKEGENDIRVDTYNTALRSLLDAYNKIYPKGNDGSRSLTKNAANLFTSYTTSADGKTVTLGDGANSIKLTPEEFDKFKYSKELDPKKNKEFFDAYIKNQKKWTSTDPAESGSGYRNVPTPWVDATPKYDLKGIDHPGVDDSEFNMDMRGMFRHPVFYDDKTLGKENMPLLYTTGMANEYNGSILQREEHYNPAIYPKPNYSIEGVEPVISGRPSWGASATINGQQYTVGAPTQNSNFDQFYSIPASAMPGPSAENVFVDTPDSVWMQNYKNKMNLYDVTQQNLARLKEYDPNYNVVTNYDVSDPRYDPYQKFDNNPSNTRTDKYNKRMEGYEQRYTDDPSVGFYQAGPNEEINEPCVGCGTLYGSKRSADANTTYRTYDVQYPEKGVYSKKDLERAKEHYTIKDSGNPGHSYLWKYTDDGNSGYNQALIGSVFNRDFLNDEQQVQFDAPGGGTAVVDYNPEVQKVYQDQRDVWQTIEDERGVKQNAQNNLNRAQQKIKEENAARELWEKQQREKQNKKIKGPKIVEAPPGGFAYGGEIDPDKPKVEFHSKSKSKGGNYVVNQTLYDNGTSDSTVRRSLKGFIKDAPKPGEPGAPAKKFADGGDISVPDLRRVKIHALPKAQYGPPDWNYKPNLGVNANYNPYANSFRPKVATAQSPAIDVRKVAQPTAVAESTNRNITHAIPENWQELKAEADAQAAYDALPEAMKRRDVLSAKRTTPAQETVNQIYYALSNPVEAAGHAMKYGYLPQGNVGNYGLRQDGDAFSDTFNNFVNPFAWGNAAYRFANDVTDKDSWTTGLGAANMGADFAEALPFYGGAAKTMLPAVESFAAHPLINGLHDVAASPRQFGPNYLKALTFKALETSILDDIIGKSIQEAGAFNLNPTEVFIRNAQKNGIIPANANVKSLVDNPNLLNTVVTRGIKNNLTVGRRVTPSAGAGVAESSMGTITPLATGDAAALSRFTGDPVGEAFHMGTHIPREAYGMRSGLQSLPNDVDALYFDAPGNFAKQARATPNQYGDFTVTSRIPFEYSSDPQSMYAKYMQMLQETKGMSGGQGAKPGDIFGKLHGPGAEESAIIGRPGQQVLEPVSVSTINDYNKPLEEFDELLKLSKEDPEKFKAAFWEKYNSGQIARTKQEAGLSDNQMFVEPLYGDIKNNPNINDLKFALRADAQNKQFALKGAAPIQKTNFSPLTTNFGNSAPVQLTGSQANRRLATAQKQFDVLNKRGYENLTLDELLDALNLEAKLNKAGESGSTTLDKWPTLFGNKTAGPVNTPLGPQAELDLANARAKAFSESAFNKLKLQRFRPGETFNVSNQEARFMDDPELVKMYNDYSAMDPNNPLTFNEWFIKGHGQYGPPGRYGTNAFGDTNDILAINKVNDVGAPAKNILIDAAHETTHSRSLRLKSTQAERDIAMDAWQPMVDVNMANNNQWSIGPASGFNQAAEETFAVQNELRTFLNDFDGSKVYTDADIPEIQSALQKLASTDHPYLTQDAVNLIDIKKLIKSLNVIGLGVTAPLLINATKEQKKRGGRIKNVDFLASRNKAMLESLPKAQVLGPIKLNIPQQFQQSPNLMAAHVAMPQNSGFGDFTTHSVYDAVKSGDFNHMEEAIDKYFGYPQDRAFQYVDSRQEGDNDPSDNERHGAAGLFTQQAIKNKIDIPIIGDAAGWLGANAMGIGHELGTMFEDERPWSDKLQEAGEDIFNNFAGSTLGVLPGSQNEKLDILHGLSVGNWLPDGVVWDGGKNNLYLKDEQGNVNRDSPMDIYNRMFQKKQGGVIKQVRIKSLPKAQTGFQVLTDANGKYVFVKT